MAPKSNKKNKEPIPLLDKTFYELTIENLHKKMSHLRSHLKKMETRNDEIETIIRQLEEDRTDVLACLDRKLQTKDGIIKELEEKLLHSNKLRCDETIEFQRNLKESQLDYKQMQEELTSEIKVLTGHVNSLEEFRVHKEQLLAKFDEQESQLHTQIKNQREIIYQIQRKQAFETDAMKQDVRNRLLQLSDDFTKANEVRISEHVQRLVRENIALNNELDRMMFSQRRIQMENQLLRQQQNDRRVQSAVVAEERASLVRSSDLQLQVIEKLTTKCEDVCSKNAKLEALGVNRSVRDKHMQVACQDLKDYENKVKVLEQHVHAIRIECHAHKMTVKQQAAEVKRLLNIFKELKFTIQSVANTDQRPNDDPIFRSTRRKYLVDDLLKILMMVEQGPPAIVSSCETVKSIQNLYLLREEGVSAESLDNLVSKSVDSLRFDNLLEVYDGKYISIHSDCVVEVSDSEKSEESNINESWPIFDVESCLSELVFSESTKEEDKQVEDEEPLEVDMGELSSDDEVPVIAADDKAIPSKNAVNSDIVKKGTSKEVDSVKAFEANFCLYE